MTTRRKSGGWLAWWLAPVGSGPRGTRRRTSGATRTTGGWLAWWLAPVGSGPRGTRRRTSGATRTTGGWLSWWLARPGTPGPVRLADHDRPTKVRGGPRTCPLCHKGAACRCTMVKGEPIRRKRRPSGAAPYAYPTDFRANGAVWCGSCRHRINSHTGHCSNTRCPR